MHIWAYLHLAVCAIMEIQLQNAQFKGKTFEEYNLITEMSFLHAVLVCVGWKQLLWVPVKIGMDKGCVTETIWFCFVSYLVYSEVGMVF